MIQNSNFREMTKKFDRKTRKITFSHVHSHLKVRPITSKDRTAKKVVKSTGKIAFFLPFSSKFSPFPLAVLSDCLGAQGVEAMPQVFLYIYHIWNIYLYTYIRYTLYLPLRTETWNVHFWKNSFFLNLKIFIYENVKLC